MKYYLGIDTETCGSIGKPLTYDISWNISDETGKIVHSHSYVVQEVFFRHPWLMKHAVYAKNIPHYYKEILRKKKYVAKLSTIYNRLLEDINSYHIKEIYAHNAKFDLRALQTTFKRKMKKPFSLPKNVTLLDTMKMAKQTICKTEEYKNFVTSNSLLTPTGKIPANAQALYAYLTNDPTYKEQHMALEDTIIEKDIFQATNLKGVKRKVYNF